MLSNTWGRTPLNLTLKEGKVYNRTAYELITI